MRRTVMPGGMSLLRRSMLKYVRQNHVSIPKQVGNMTGAMFRYVSQDGIHFVRDVLRLKLVEVRRQEVVMKLKLRPAFWLKEALTGDVAQTHSGLLVAAIDHVGGACAMTVLPRPGLMLSTVNLQVDYCNALIPADQGEP